MGKGNILIIDDDKSVLKSLKLILENEFDLVETIRNPNSIPHYFNQNKFDVIILDMNFSTGVNTGNEGLFWLSEILKIDKEAVVIMLTAYGDIELSVDAMKRGATDFIIKPWENAKLIATLRAGLKLRTTKNQVQNLKQKQILLTEGDYFSGIRLIGSSSSFLQVMKTIEKVSKTDVNVLLIGENGTGKGLVARRIHNLSKRSGEVFINLDTSAISASLFESELFGHKEGAFTDAKQSRIGRIQSASGGTLFLDEIGNLSRDLQAKLLTVLQERKVTPIGSNIAEEVDVRLISATNKNLALMAEKGQFRDDLLYRLKVIQIEIPPLRERVEDIPELVEFFLDGFKNKYDKKNLSIDEKAFRKLKRYKWPGNIRELEHAIEKAVILTENNVLTDEDFSFTLQRDHNISDSLNLEDVEKRTVEKALNKCRGNISKASEMLGVTRKTLYKKIEKYGL